MNKASIARMFRVVTVVTATAGAVVGGLGCGGSDTLTLGSYCSQTGSAACDRAIMCGLYTAKSTCTSDFQAGCCGDDGTCGQTPVNAQAEMAARQLLVVCPPAFKNFDCAELAAGNAPDACTMLPAASSALSVALPSPSVASPSTSVAKVGAKTGRGLAAQP